MVFYECFKFYFSTFFDILYLKDDEIEKINKNFNKDNLYLEYI